MNITAATLIGIFFFVSLITIIQIVSTLKQMQKNEEIYDSLLKLHIRYATSSRVNIK